MEKRVEVTWTLTAVIEADEKEYDRVLDRISANIEEQANKEAACAEIVDLLMDQQVECP